MYPCKRPSQHARPKPVATYKTVLSRDLFRDGPVLRIVHGDQVYELRRTGNDKLILTK